jgi:hypothetical protein
LGVAQALETYPVVFLKNHGVVVCGTSIDESVIIALMLENACQIQMIAEAAGETAPEFPTQDVMALRKKLLSPEQQEINVDRARTVADATLKVAAERRFNLFAGVEQLFGTELGADPHAGVEKRGLI